MTESLSSCQFTQDWHNLRLFLRNTNTASRRVSSWVMSASHSTYTTWPNMWMPKCSICICCTPCSKARSINREVVPLLLQLFWEGFTLDATGIHFHSSTRTLGRAEARYSGLLRSFSKLLQRWGKNYIIGWFLMGQIQCLWDTLKRFQSSHFGLNYTIYL